MSHVVNIKADDIQYLRYDLSLQECEEVLEQLTKDVDYIIDSVSAVMEITQRHVDKIVRNGEKK